VSSLEARPDKTSGKKKYLKGSVNKKSGKKIFVSQGYSVICKVIF
jgi:hypothetical protein